MWTVCAVAPHRWQVVPSRLSASRRSRLHARVFRLATTFSRARRAPSRRAQARHFTPADTRRPHPHRRASGISSSSPEVARLVGKLVLVLRPREQTSCLLELFALPVRVDVCIPLRLGQRTRRLGEPELLSRQRTELVP